MSSNQFTLFSFEVPLVAAYKKPTVLAVSGASSTSSSSSSNGAGSVSTSITGIIKSTSGTLSSAVAGVDYVTPSGSISGSAGSVASLSGHNISELSNDLTTANVPSSSDARYVTDSNLSVINSTSGINTGDETSTSIKTKLGAASSTSDGFLTKEDYIKLTSQSNSSEQSIAMSIALG